MECVGRLGGFMLKVAPERGGKTVDIRCYPVPRNLLLGEDPNAVLALEHGDRFGVSGWDEIVPTLEPEGDIPTLGYAWRTGAHCAIDGNSLRTSWRVPGWSLEREIRAQGNTLVSRSSVCNTLETSQPMIWAAHVLYPLEGMVKVTLPGGEARPGPGCDTQDLKQHLAVDQDGWQVLDFANTGRSWKFFLKADRDVKLQYNDVVLTVSTDAPWWGVWLNRGAFCNIVCIGIEPTTDPTDYLRESSTIVAARGTIEHTWSLTSG